MSDFSINKPVVKSDFNKIEKLKANPPVLPGNTNPLPANNLLTPDQLITINKQNQQAIPGKINFVEVSKLTSETAKPVDGRAGSLVPPERKALILTDLISEHIEKNDFVLLKASTNELEKLVAEESKKGTFSPEDISNYKKILDLAYQTIGMMSLINYMNNSPDRP